MSERLTTEDVPRGLEISLPARAENVALVRHALAGLAEQIGMDPTGVADLKTVVTEACMNVAVHAYDGNPGPLNVVAEPDADGLTVVVRDFGIGIRPRADVAQPSLRLGLSLIAALSSSFSFSGGLDRGTVIEMRIPLQGGGADDGGPSVETPATVDQTEIVVGSPEFLAPVLERIVGILAARRELSVERVSDAVLLTDAIAAAAPERFADGTVRLALADSENGVEVRLGPMEAGSAERIRSLLALPEAGGSLETLADDFSAEATAEGDYLAISFTASAPAP